MEQDKSTSDVVSPFPFKEVATEAPDKPLQYTETNERPWTSPATPIQPTWLERLSDIMHDD